MSRITLSVAAGLLCTQSALAQQPPSQLQQKAIPIRQLGAITAASKDTLGPNIVTRGLSDGSVLVGIFPLGGGPAQRGVKLFDSTLQHSTLVREPGNSAQLIRYTGDSTLTIDKSQALLLLDARGNTVRAMAPPKAGDFNTLRGYVRTPQIDPNGRLIYQGVMPPPPRAAGSGAASTQGQFQPDSAPIIRADFDTRQVDTLTTIKVARPTSMSTALDGQNVTYTVVYSPTSTADEWAMLNDGTIAIVRAQDYHIDWVSPDGSRRSTPKMPFDWKRITEAQKQFTFDSLNSMLDSVRKRVQPRTVDTPTGRATYSYKYEVEPVNKSPDFEPPIGPGSVRADLDGNVWIVPRTSAAAKGGVLYDVVNREGVITERVQLPKGVAIVGFGPRGVVYLIRVDGNIGFLERANVR